MKLSSAFDNAILLKGCSGKQSPVLDEVASAVGTDISYLDKSNSMKKIESFDDVPVESFNGIFSLSDESGINTIAYGGAGTIYGCYNYSSENIASYSKTYAGSTINSSAYAVAIPDESAQADASNPSADASSLSKQDGILIGASADGLHVYSEASSEEGAAKTWNTLRIDGMPDAEIYGVFSAGTMFFIPTSAGLAAFDASAVDRSTSEVPASKWSFANIPQWLSDDSGNLARISFIRKVHFEIGTAKADAYAIGCYTGDGEDRRGSAALMAEDGTGWHFVKLQWNGTSIVSDVVAVNNATFPDLVQRGSGSDRSSDYGEDIRLLNSRGVNVTSVAKSNGYPVLNTENCITLQALRLKTSEGYAVLAVLDAETDAANFSNVENVNLETDRGRESLFTYHEVAVGGQVEYHWIQRKPWAVLDCTDPLPLSLSNGMLYRVAAPYGGGSVRHARWIESYEVSRIDGAADPAFPSPYDYDSNVVDESDQSIIVLKNDSAAQNKIVIDIDITSYLGYSDLDTAYICFAAPNGDFAVDNVYKDITSSSRSGYWQYTSVSSGSYDWVSVSSHPNPDDAAFNLDSNGNVEQAYQVLKAYPQSGSIASSTSFFKTKNSEGTYTRAFSAKAEYRQSDSSKTIRVVVSLNDYSIPYIDFNLNVKVAIRKTGSSSIRYAYLKDNGKNSEGALSWTARTSALIYPAYVQKRLLYSQTGTFIQKDGSYIGNRIECSLTISNSGQWFYSMHPSDRMALKSLRSESAVPAFRKRTLSAANGSTFSRNILLGEVSLGLESGGSESELRFAKTGQPSSQGTISELLMADGDEFKPFLGKLSWRKSTVGELNGGTLAGDLYVQVASVTVTDASCYADRWNEDFVDCPYVQIGAGETKIFTQDTDAYAFTRQTAESGGAFDKYGILDAPEAAAEYAFDYEGRNGLGCLSKIAFNENGFPSLEANYRYVSAKAAGTGTAKYFRILGSTFLCTIPIGAESQWIADGTRQNAFLSSASECLNFKSASDSFYRFTPKDTSIAADDEAWLGYSGTKSVCTVYESGGSRYLRVRYEKCAEADIPQIDARYRAFSLESGIPIWIGGAMHWLEINGASSHPDFHYVEGGTVLGDVLYRLVPLANENELDSLLYAYDDTHEMSPMAETTGGEQTAGDSSRFSQRVTVWRLWFGMPYAEYANGGPNIQIGNTYRRMYWFSPDASSTGSVPWTANAEVHLDSAKRLGSLQASPDFKSYVLNRSGQYSIARFSRQTVSSTIETAFSAYAVSLASNLSLTAAVDACTMYYARNESGYADYERRLAFNGIDAAFFKGVEFEEASIVSFTQYSTLKQWRLEPQAPMKLVAKRMPSAANPNVNGNSWKLYEEALSEGGKQIWDEWPVDQYEGSRVPVIRTPNDWPAFVPSIGTVYYVDTDHTTAEPKYTAGYYVYHSTGSSIMQCYAKLPGFGARQRVYVSGTSEYKANWRDWTSSPEASYVLLVGRSNVDGTIVGKGWMAKIGFDSGQLAVYGDWIDAGTFRTAGSNALPNASSVFGASIGTGDSERDIAVCFTVRAENGGTDDYQTVNSFKIIRKYDFKMPCLAGMFELAAGGSYYGVSERLDKVGREGTDLWNEVNETPMTTEYALAPASMSVLGRTSSSNPPSWEWVTSITPRKVAVGDYGDFWMVGVYGYTTAAYPVAQQVRTTYSSIVYARNINAASQNGTGTMPSIKRPNLSAAEGTEDGCGVLWNRQGFHVKFRWSNDAVNGAGFDIDAVANLSGSESMASKRAIKAMTALKAYNAPIVFGLYERGGLILYYGQKCFDMSILAESRIGEDGGEGDENSLSWHIEEEAQKMAESLFIPHGIEGESVSEDALAAALETQKKASALLDAWMPSDNDSIASLAQRFGASYSGRYAVAGKIERAAGRAADSIPSGADTYWICAGGKALNANVSLSASLEQAYEEMVLHCFRKEARRRLIREADARLIESCEYSVNNSSTSQWIDVPILYRGTDGTIAEPKEDLSTLTTAVTNGRIRVSVGSKSGNVYWRDLNPLHADRYISYIPVPFLSQAEQTEIASQAGLDYDKLGTAELRSFISGSGSEGAAASQTLYSGWTNVEWRYGGLQPIANQNRYLALPNSSATIFKTLKVWLFADEMDLNIRLTYAQAREVDAGRMPYVRKRTWKWRIGDVETSVDAYANIPVVERNSSKNNEFWWKIGSVFRAKYSRTMMPTIVEQSGKLYWQFGTPPNSVRTAVQVQKNGTPYVQNDEWYVVQNGASSPTKLGVAGPGTSKLQAVPGEAMDEWAVENRNGIVYRSAAKGTTASVSFTSRIKQFWELDNVTQIKDDGTIGTSGSIVTDHELKNGESQKDCPYVLAPAMKAVIDEYGESPVWKTHNASSTNDVTLAKSSNLFIQERNGTYVLASADSSAYRTLGSGSASGGNIPYWLGKSGKEFWLSATGGTIGEYCSDAEPVSVSGSRWTSTSNETTVSARKTAYFDMWDLPANAKASMKTGVKIVFKTIGGTVDHTRTWTDADTYAKEIDTAIFEWRKANPAGSTTRTERKYWAVGDYVLYYNGSGGSVSKTYTENSNLLTDAWQRPSFKCAVWNWNLKRKNGTYNDSFKATTTASSCPYRKLEEVCVWKNGSAIDELDAAHGISLETVETSTWHWFADGTDLDVNCMAPTAANAFKDFTCTPVWTLVNGENVCQFQWNLWNGSGWLQNVFRTAASANPLTKRRAVKWAARDSSGKLVVLNRLAQDPMAGKGLETDGIAARSASSQVWNEKTEQWESVPNKAIYSWSDAAGKWTPSTEEAVSWTPLASVFVDAYREVSKGVLGSIKNPYLNKEGMLWELIPSEDLFGEDGVTISDSASNAWKAYSESESGNKAGCSFTVYIGYKENNGLWDNFCSIVSDSTGSIHRWVLSEKDWRFEHLELVCRQDGTLDRIVIMGSFGWIVASGQITFANEGKDIRGMAWQNPVNPVKPVLQELEKVQAYKWNSWTSSWNTEFAAVGSYGVYVYSSDCITFEASIPYGMDAILSEVVWDPETGEFVIHAIAQTSGSGEETDTVEWTQDEIETDFEDVHSENTTTKADESPVLVSTLVDDSVYTHTHKTVNGKSETRWYRFSSALTSFEELADPTAAEKKGAQTIVPDNTYKWTSNGRTWSFVYSKYDSKGSALGAGYTGTGWVWQWGRKDASSGASGSLSYITISKNMKAVAYGFPDLIRFIRAYKNTYTESMEFVGGVGTFISAERESVNESRKALMEPYEELAKMGSSGLGMYSGKLQTAYKIYLEAKRLRDASHYADNDCHNVYLQRIGQSLALEYKDFFNRAKRAMWTAQAFRNYYEKLAKKGK